MYAYIQPADTFCAFEQNVKRTAQNIIKQKWNQLKV